MKIFSKNITYKTFLPIENITYKTKLDEKEIFNRMSQSVMTKNSSIRTENGVRKIYKGDLNSNNFNITKILINQKNSFQPVITGEIQTQGNWTIIRINMMPYKGTIVFIFFWYSFLIPGIISDLSKMSNKGHFSPGVLPLFGMCLFMYVLTMGGFKFESIRSIKYFKKLFEAEIEDNSRFRNEQK